LGRVPAGKRRSTYHVEFKTSCRFRVLVCPWRSVTNQFVSLSHPHAGIEVSGQRKIEPCEFHTGKLDGRRKIESSAMPRETGAAEADSGGQSRKRCCGAVLMRSVTDESRNGSSALCGLPEFPQPLRSVICVILNSSTVWTWL